MCSRRSSRREENGGKKVGGGDGVEIFLFRGRCDDVDGRIERLNVIF